MPWSAIIPAAASLIGGAMNSSAAGDAAQAQTEAAGKSAALQSLMYNQTRADNAPFLQNGTLANARLAYLLGLGDPNAESKSAAALASGLKKPTWEDAAAEQAAWHQAKYGSGLTSGSDLGANQSQTQARLDRMLQEYDAQVAALPASSTAAPSEVAGGSYGSLLKRFSADDLNADPVYQSGLQFGMDQGRDAINARALQSGSYDSGATLKALTRFGNDYGSTKANESYNRYTNDQNSIYGKLSGQSMAGQQAVQTTASAGQTATNGMANSIDAAGNARAAGVVGGANAWGGALNGVNTAYQNYNSNELLKKIINGKQPDFSGYTTAP